MYEDRYISYNGKKSSDFNIYFCDPVDYLLQEPFLSNRSIREDKNAGRAMPYFYGIEYDSYEFPLKFWCSDWTQEKINQVTRWLGEPQYYSELYSSGNQDRCYFCLYTGKVDYETTHNGWALAQFTMQSSSPFVYSRQRINYYDFSNSTTTQNITFNNLGSMSLKPEIQITMASDSNGSFSIKNLRNNNLTMSFTGLSPNENVSIDCENEDIASSLANTYRINNMTGNFMEFVYGKNPLQVTGKVSLEIRYRYIYY